MKNQISCNLSGSVFLWNTKCEINWSEVVMLFKMLTNKKLLEEYRTKIQKERQQAGAEPGKAQPKLDCG